MKTFVPMLSLTIVLFFSCKNRNTSVNRGAETSKYIQDTIAKLVHESVTNFSPSKSALKVSAHLVYDDGTLSSFDILNDKTIALWNVVAGGGDASKPSNSTKVKLTGNLDSLNIKIKNGQELVIDTIIIHSDKDVEYVVKNTGCVEVYVDAIRSRKLVYNDTIPFRCGE